MTKLRISAKRNLLEHLIYLIVVMLGLLWGVVTIVAGNAFDALVMFILVIALCASRGWGQS